MIIAEGIVNTADMAHRPRFLSDKYPQLRDEEPLEAFVGDGTDDADEKFSVLDELAQEGGPDLP